MFSVKIMKKIVKNVVFVFFVFWEFFKLYESIFLNKVEGYLIIFENDLIIIIIFWDDKFLGLK